MKKQNIRRLVIVMLAVAMLLPCFSTVSMAAEEMFHVTPSTTDYTVTMKNAQDFFIYNKETLGSKIGTEYYLTYTVQSATAEKFFQHGVLGCTAPSSLWPYVTDAKGNGGHYKYDFKNKLFLEGYTYFFKFTVTEDGYSYRAAWAKGAESAYIKFGAEYGSVKKDLDYFGVWSSDVKLNGKLIRVRCYDKDGNDLGVKVSSGKGVTVGREQPYPKDKDVDHSYTVTISDVYNFSIGSKRGATGNKVYIEYTVESSDSLTWQNGIVLGNNPTAAFPYQGGYMKYGVYEQKLSKATDGPLLVEGADYLMIFEKKENDLDITIQRTLNGETTWIAFPLPEGTYKPNAEFYSIWFGDGTNFKINAVLTNFKIYDSNKNNLGVQANQACKIEHHGEIEDYAGCESMYYCKELSSLYALYADKTVKHTLDNATSQGTYRIENSVLTTDIESEKKNYNYTFLSFTDENENVYERLRDYKVTFETGEGSKVEQQILNPENGYMVMKPTDPTCKGNTFEGWYTAEGEEYKFGNIATESITLYARWQETEYIRSGSSTLRFIANYWVYGVCGLMLIASVTGGALLIRRKKCDE